MSIDSVLVRGRPELLVVGAVLVSCVLYGIAYWLRRIEEAADDA